MSSIFGDWVASAQSFVSRLNTPTKIAGVIMLLASLFFNIIAFLPVIIRPDPIKQIQNIWQSKDLMLVIALVLNIIVGVGIAYTISYFEVSGRAGWYQSNLNKVKMITAYIIGILLNIRGMMIIGPLPDVGSGDWFWIMSLILVFGFIFEVAPELMLEDAFAASMIGKKKAQTIALSDARPISQARSRTTCSNCGHAVPPGVPVCTRCGELVNIESAFVNAGAPS